jgi:hypothetical protein
LLTSESEQKDEQTMIVRKGLFHGLAYLVVAAFLIRLLQQERAILTDTVSTRKSHLDGSLEELMGSSAPNNATTAVVSEISNNQSVGSVMQSGSEGNKEIRLQNASRSDNGTKDSVSKKGITIPRI